MIMAIQEAKKAYNPKKIEENVQEYWEERDIFNRINKLNENTPTQSQFIEPKIKIIRAMIFVMIILFSPFSVRSRASTRNLRARLAHFIN